MSFKLPQASVALWRMCTDVTCFCAHCFFPPSDNLAQNLGKMRKFPSKQSLSSVSLIKKNLFPWTDGNRPLLFHSLTTNSSIVVINVVSKSCFCSPDCIETCFVVLDFIHCLSHLEGLSSRICLLRTLWYLCRTSSVLTHLGLSPFPKKCFHWIFISILSILLPHGKSNCDFSSS